MARRGISNGDKVIDSRDVIKRLAELEDERHELEAAFEEATAAVKELADDCDEEEREEAEEAASAAENDLASWDEDNGDELTALQELNEEGERCADWTHGATLIHEAYWEEYVEEMLKDCGELPAKIPHYIVIDWEQTAENVAQDYSTVDFAGETYYVRSC